MADNVQAPTGAMVAAYPDNPETLALDGYEPADRLHVTLAYLGDAADVADDVREDVHRLAAAIAADYLPFDASVTGIAEFGSGTEEACAVLLVEAAAFEGMRDTFMAHLAEMLPMSDAKPHFVPHITLGYGADPGALEDYAGRSVTFSRIGAAFGEEVGMHGLGDTTTLDDDVATMAADNVDPEVEPDEEEEDEEPIEDFAVSEDGRWQGVLVIEGVESGDGRLIAEGALSWRELPLPLMGMFRNPEGGDGHDGAVLVGTIDTIERDGRVIRAEGAYDLASPAGAEAYRLGVDQMLRGVSVDLDKVAIEWENEPPIGEDVGLQDLFDFDPGTMIVSEARIMGATLCPFPAFEEAFIEVLTVDSEPITAAAVLGDCVECGDGVDPLADNSDREVVWAMGQFATAEEVPPGTDVVFMDPVVPDVEHVGVVVGQEGDRVDVELIDAEGTATGVVVSLPLDMVAPAVAASPEEEEPEEEEPGIEIEIEAAALTASGSPPMPGATLRLHRPIGGTMTALVASAAPIVQAPPVHPPAEWFTLPDDPKVEPVRFSKEGRVAGFVATHDSCHIGFRECVRPPRSSSNYAKFRTGEVLTAEGTLVATGTVMMDTVHPSLKMSASDAQAFYAHTGSAAADVAVYETDKGIYIAGALRPSVTPAQVRVLRASDFSPDWRRLNGSMEMVALLAVNTSGFIVDGLVASAGNHPVVMPRGRMVDGEMTALVAAGMVTRESLRQAGLAQTVKRLVRHVEALDREVAPQRAERAAALLQSRFGVQTKGQRQAAAREIVQRIAVRAS